MKTACALWARMSASIPASRGPVVSIVRGKGHADVFRPDGHFKASGKPVHHGWGHRWDRNADGTIPRIMALSERPDIMSFAGFSRTQQFRVTQSAATSLSR